MIREVKFKDEVKEGQRKGAETVYRAVASTMGAKGKYVGVQNHFHENYVTKDGYYTSKTIILRDPIENFGASMIKEVAQKSASAAGDGTTTSTVITYKIYEKGQQAIDNGANAVDIKKGINIAVKNVVKELKKNSIPLKGNDMLRQVATVSANNDEEIGGLIADAMKQIKPEGSVIVEESIGYGSDIEVVEGMRIDQGYISNYFVNNNERETCELDKVFILTYYGTISTLSQILPVMEYAAENQASLLVVALEIEQEAFQTLVRNKVEGGMKISAVRVPGVGSTRQSWIGDISASCGSVVMSENGGDHFGNFNPDMLGSARKIKMDKHSTTIIEGGYIESDLNERVATIKNKIKTAKKSDNVSLYKDRLAKLIGGVAIIHVGSTTEVELREKKDLFEDAIAATKSAFEEGVLPGGGSSLVVASSSLDLIHSENKDIQLGIDIVQKSLYEPLLTIMNNAGLNGLEILTSVIMNNNKNYGFNLNTEKYCDMIESGILDTTKVERMAVENSASVAAIMLMTDTVIYTVNEKE